MANVSEVTPLVIDALQRAGSQDASVLKPAEQQLKDWETQPGFYSTLQGIFSDQTIDTNIRFLAVVCFKNGVDRYWRRHAPNSLTEEEKAFLRQKLISHFNEPVTPIATQHAVLVAKIARLDCPRLWPELLPTLIEGVKCEDTFTQQRAMLTLYHVVKALASKRLAMDRITFEELTNNMFCFVLTLWDTHTNKLLEVLQTQDGNAASMCIDHTILALKVLRKLAVFGLKTPEEYEPAKTFINLVFQRIEELIQSKKAFCVCGRDLPQKREKLITLLIKVLLDMQDNHAGAYIPFIKSSLQMCVTFNFTDAGTDLLYERFTVNTFNLMRSVLRTELYRPAKKIEDTQNPLTLAAHKIKSEFFTDETLRGICSRLIGRYLVLSDHDLQSWDADPEDYLSDEGGDSWKFSLRPCVENLYQTLMKEYRSSLTPVVVELLQQHAHDTDPNNMQAVLQKDAVYNAVGLASFDLYDDIDFDGWFHSRLVPELQNKHTNFRILRRRVVWLIGCWVGVKFSSDNQPVLYQSLLPLLQPEEDLVVRMEAAFTLRLAVDDFEFKPEHFTPYLESSFGLLFQLLKDVDECETKMQILHVMSFIIDRLRIEIRPHVGALIHYLPMLWQASESHNMLRCAILNTLTCLVQGLGPVCVSLFDFLLPVIQLSTDVSQDPHVYLCEDGLELWYNTLLSTPTMTPQLLDVYTNMSALLELGSETLRTCLKTIEGYIVLAPDQFLQKYAGTLVSDMASLITDLKTEAAVMVYKVIELVFKVAPRDGPKLFSRMLPNIVKQFVDSNDYPMVTSMYIALFSRMILKSEDYFWELLAELAQGLGLQNSEVLATFLDVWLEKLDNMIQPDQRKLSAMALATLLTSKQSVVLDRIALIVNACVETLHDVYKLDPETELEQQLDCLVIGQADLPPDDEETEHERRKHKLSYQDPVHTVNLCSFVAGQMRALQQQVGDENFQKLLDLVDPDVFSQLQRFIK